MTATKKVLMLHGYVQSGKIFSSKTGGLRKSLKKLGYELYYPTAPIKLDKQLIAKLHGSSEKGKAEDIDIASEYSSSNTAEDLYGWYLIDKTRLGEYKLEQATFDSLHDYVVQNGPFDGIMGFSQGAGIAGYLLTDFNGILNLSEEEQPPIKFFVSFSGFRLAPEAFQEAYNKKKLTTPSLHVQGELDSVVTEARAGALYDCFEPSSRTLIKHPGGHFVPSAKRFVLQIGGWLQNVASAQSAGSALDSQADKQEPEVDDDLLSMIDAMGKI